MKLPRRRFLHLAAGADAMNPIRQRLDQRRREEWRSFARAIARRAEEDRRRQVYDQVIYIPLGQIFGPSA